ncbi:MAG: hypothetical protein NVSMB24_38190 [Mucilaginibacter sp.]
MKNQHDYYTMEANKKTSGKQAGGEAGVMPMDHEKMQKDHDAHSGMSEHDHHAMMIADFKKRFYVVLALTIPVMLLSMQIQQWLHLDVSFTGSSYLLFALASAVFVYGGWPFLTGWMGEMKAINPGMMTLIDFAITVAYAYSTATVFGLKGMDFFWELDALILIMLLGHWIEMRSVMGTVPLDPQHQQRHQRRAAPDQDADQVKPDDPSFRYLVLNAGQLFRAVRQSLDLEP